MKLLSPPTAKHLTFAAIILALLSGCQSGINPKSADPNVGYVDFYDTTSGRQWSVLRQSSGGEVSVGTRSLKNAFIRAESPPGSHRFKVVLRRGNMWDMKDSTLPYDQLSFDVNVTAGMITPVNVQLVPIQQETPSGRPIADRYQMGVTVDAQISFRRKEEMPYYHKTPLL